MLRTNTTPSNQEVTMAKGKFEATFEYEGTTKNGKVRLGDPKEPKQKVVGSLYLPTGTPVEDGDRFRVVVEKIED
jgi:hypothetical protein